MCVYWQWLLCNHLLTYLCPPPLPGYGPPKVDLQRFLSWAILSSWLQLKPILVTSASSSRRHVLFGRPRFRLPWGFHLRVCLVMFVGGLRRVCPIQPHLLFQISTSIGSWHVLSHRLVLLIVSGQRMWRILLRQVLMKVWILLLVALVVLQVSAPYSSTDFTLELNSLILVVKVSSLEAQMFLSWMKAPLVLPILALTSASVPPCWSMMLPR